MLKLVELKEIALLLYVRFVHSWTCIRFLVPMGSELYHHLDKGFDISEGQLII